MKKKIVGPSPLRIAKMFFGALLLIWGLFALFTPFTPGAWLAFVGMELLGIRFIADDRKPHPKWLKWLDGMQKRFSISRTLGKRWKWLR
jgi:hypothetical protein